MMIVSGGNVAITMVLALLVMSPTIVSSVVYSNRRWSTDRAVARRWDGNRATGGIRARSSCRSTRGCRQELRCGLQITVRIRGKKSREEDYTNQVRGWRDGNCRVLAVVTRVEIHSALCAFWRRFMLMLMLSDYRPKPHVRSIGALGCPEHKCGISCYSSHSSGVRNPV